MQTKIIGGLFGLLFGGVCFEAGRISQREQKDDYSTSKVQIEHPQLQGVNSPNPVQTQTQQKTIDTFMDSLIEPPFRKITYPHFKILYSTYHKCPLAVHEKFTKQLADGDAPRRSTFFTEKSLENQFQSTNDHFIKSGAYKNFNFARGHMAAAGNYSGNKDAKWMTFTYANVIPQNQHNNAGIWNTFERYSRDLAMKGKCDSVEVISGPIYFKNSPYQGQNGEKYDNVFQEQSMVLLQNGMVVPEKLYKIVKCNTKTGEQYLDAFEFWNKKTFDNDMPLKAFRTSLQSLENQTGLKFNFAKNTSSQPESIKSLVEFDPEGFEKTKRVYDQRFYTNLMKRSSSVEDMNSSFMRAKEQHIFITLQDFKEQTQKLFKQDIEAIRLDYEKSQQNSACFTLNKLVKLNKSLHYLKQLNDEYEQQIRSLQDSGPLEQCLQKANQLRETPWQNFVQTEEPTRKPSTRKQEKVSLNSLTYTVTKSLKNQKQAAQREAAPVEEVKGKSLSLVNEDRLKEFVVPVNNALAVAVAGANTEASKEQKAQMIEIPQNTSQNKTVNPAANISQQDV